MATIRDILQMANSANPMLPDDARQVDLPYQRDVAFSMQAEVPQSDPTAFDTGYDTVRTYIARPNPGYVPTTEDAMEEERQQLAQMAGGDPLEFDVKGEVEKRVNSDLPDLYKHVFGQKSDYRFAGELKGEKKRYWTQAVDQYRSNVARDVSQEHSKMAAKYQRAEGDLTAQREGQAASATAQAEARKNTYKNLFSASKQFGTELGQLDPDYQAGKAELVDRSTEVYYVGSRLIDIDNRLDGATAAALSARIIRKAEAQAAEQLAAAKQANPNLTDDELLGMRQKLIEDGIEAEVSKFGSVRGNAGPSPESEAVSALVKTLLGKKNGVAEAKGAAPGTTAKQDRGLIGERPAGDVEYYKALFR